jgi:hypothetical protein
METASIYQSKHDSPPPTVYLAGSIDAHATLDSILGWRAEAREALTAAGYRVLDPLRWGDSGPGAEIDSAEIMRRNLVDILAADILLVEMDHPGLSYIGTGIEVFQAYQLGKEILLWGTANRRSHALRHYAPIRYETLGEALCELVERIEKTRGAMINV